MTEIDLLNHMLLTDHEHTADETIESLIDRNVPVVRPNTPLETLMGIFSSSNVAVIATDGHVEGILTRSTFSISVITSLGKCVSRKGAKSAKNEAVFFASWRFGVRF